MRSSFATSFRQLQRLLRDHRKAIAVLLAVIGYLFYVFGDLAHDVWHEESFTWDQAILVWVHSGASPMADAWMLWISGTGYVLAIVGAPLVAIVFLIARWRLRDACFVVTAALGASGLVAVLKIALHRPRPIPWMALAPEHSFSFPSGHAMITLTVALALMLVAWPSRWHWFFLLAGVPFALIVGFSRVYLGVHYPSDILAGWTAAVAWTLGLRVIVYRGMRVERPSSVFHPEGFT